MSFDNIFNHFITLIFNEDSKEWDIEVYVLYRNLLNHLPETPKTKRLGFNKEAFLFKEKKMLFKKR